MTSEQRDPEALARLCERLNSTRAALGGSAAAILALEAELAKVTVERDAMREATKTKQLLVDQYLFERNVASSSGTAFVVDARGEPVPAEWLCARLNATPSPSVAREREAFEKWMRDNGNSTALRKTGEDDYWEAGTRNRWAAWQAATIIKEAPKMPIPTIDFVAGITQHMGATRHEHGPGPQQDCPLCLDEISGWQAATSSATPGAREAAATEIYESASRDSGTALDYGLVEIGRAMERERCAEIADEVAARHKQDKESLDGLTATMGQTRARHFCMQVAAEGIATAIRSTPSTLDIEGLVEECAFTAYEACLDPAERDSAKAMWEKRSAILKDAWRCVARAVLTHLGLKEPIP